MAGISEMQLSGLADALGHGNQIGKLGLHLNLSKTKIDQYMATNRVDGLVGNGGTLNMLFDWKANTLKKDQVPKLKAALISAGYAELADDFFPGKPRINKSDKVQSPQHISVYA